MDDSLAGICSRENLKKVLEAGWLSAAVLVPLAFHPWGISAFDLPKSVLLQALVLLMGAAALALISGRGGTVHSRIPPMVLAAIVFAGVIVLATATSVDSRISLLGSTERRQGLLTWLSYPLLFIIVAMALRTRQQAQRLLKALVWASAPIVVYGLFQALGLDAFQWQTSAASRVLSTLGRANFLGSYLVLVIPLTLVQAIVGGAAGVSGARGRWPYVVLLVGQVVCLALTLARGAWVGFFFSVVFLGLAGSAVAGRRRWKGLTLAVVLLILIVAAVWVAPARMLQPLVDFPDVERLTALSRMDAGSVAARLTIWRFTVPLIFERPWLGYGPETMYEVFVRVFPPQLVYYQGRHVTVDRAHNLWLDLAMSFGVLGVMAFGAMLVGFAKLFWQSYCRSSERSDRIIWVGLGAAVFGHLVEQQFGFHTTGNATVFWLLLGLGVAMNRGLESEIGMSDGAKRGLLPLLPCVMLAGFCLIAIALIGVRPLLADSACWQSQQGKYPMEHRLAKAEEAVRLQPLEPAYREHLSWLAFRAGNASQAEEEILAAERLAPNDPRILAAKGAFYALWGEEEPQRLAQAESAYRRAIDLAPHIATYHTALGLILVKGGRPQEALVELERAVDLDATDGVAFAHLAKLYGALGRTDAAEWARSMARQYGMEEGESGP